jgi:hypothetical protein
VLSDLSVGGTDEGRAMLQTVHDVAPGASLAFATAALGQAAFAQSTADLRTIGGADVIVDDVLYFAEPFFQEGSICAAELWLAWILRRRACRLHHTIRRQSISVDRIQCHGPSIPCDDACRRDRRDSLRHLRGVG